MPGNHKHNFNTVEILYDSSTHTTITYIFLFQLLHHKMVERMVSDRGPDRVSDLLHKVLVPP